MSREITFSRDEMNLLRQWFNAVRDTAPEYLTDDDRRLMIKILRVLDWPHAADYPASPPDLIPVRNDPPKERG